MRMFVHTLNTWLVAHLLHPFVFVMYFLLFYDPTGYSWNWIFFIVIFSFFASIPSLFVAWLLQYVVAKTGLSLTEKYIAWVISVVVSIILNFMGLEAFFGVGLTEDVYKIVSPAVIAAVLSVLIRYKQFILLQQSVKPVENENNLI